MANEWTLVDRTEDPLDYTVADGTGIEKGTLMELTDNAIAIASTDSGQACAGVLAREKLASDGRTQVAVFKKGRFLATASGSITIGQQVANASDTTYPNMVSAVNTAIDSGSAILGYAEEVASDGEVIQVRLDL